MGVILCLFLLSWSKIISNLNLEEAFVNQLFVVDLRLRGEAFMIAPKDDEEPKTFSHALSGPKAIKWIKAMEEEMGSMKTNQV